jgi:Na+-driven multidrug efflux pump
MSRNKIFCEERFKTLLGASTVGMIIPIVVILSNAAIVGNVLDERALSAWNVFTPLLNFFIGIADIVSIGTCYVYTYKMGETDKSGADKVFGQSLLVSIVLSAITYFASGACFEIYLNYLNLSPEITQYAQDCFCYYRYVLMLYPVYFLLSDMVLMDGDAACSYLSNVLLLVVGLPVSIVACTNMGISGIGVGALVGTLGAILALCLHFFRKSNSLRPRFHFSFKLFAVTLKYSIVDASLYLLVGLQTFILNKYVIFNYGEFNLPVLTLVTSVIQLTIIFDGIGQAMTPLANVYHGEKNPEGVRKVMKISIKAALAEGLIFTLILAIFAPMIPRAFNIESPLLQELSTKALWTVCPTLCCTALLFLFTSYFLVRQSIGHSLTICALKDLLMPVLCVFAFGALLGFSGVWVGLSLAPFLTLIIGTLLSLLRFKGKKFPLFLDESEKHHYSFDFVVTTENTMSIQQKVREILTQEGVSSKNITKALLIIEEIYMFLIDHNAPKVLLSELTIVVGKHVQMIFRDDGKIFDITSEINATSSFRGFVLKNIMINQEDKKNITTTSYNRNFIILPL